MLPCFGVRSKPPSPLRAVAAASAGTAAAIARVALAADVLIGSELHVRALLGVKVSLVSTGGVNR